MTKQEFATLVVAMQTMYGEDFIGTEQALDVWYALLLTKWKDVFGSVLFLKKKQCR